MKSEKTILIAFILNLIFSVIEIIGGYLTGSVAVFSDALHDFGDAASIGIAFFLEKKSARKPDRNFTYGYARFSVLGSAVTASVLFFGSVAAIYNALNRILNPVEPNYKGMIFLAVAGILINLFAATITRKGNSLNQKAINLHMIEDVLGWIALLIGAFIIKFTNFVMIDPIISLAVSAYIIFNSAKILKKSLNLFLEKTPPAINVDNIVKQLTNIECVIDVHSIRILSTDGHNVFASMHIVTNSEPDKIKSIVRNELHKNGIHFVTLELESEKCDIQFEPTEPTLCTHRH